MANAVCYVVAGIALVVIGASFEGGQKAFGILAGLAMVGYGAKIVLTRTSYWVNSTVYVLVVIAVSWAVTTVGR